MEGCPGVVLPLTGLDFDDPLCILREFGVRRVPGAAAVMMTDARWGAEKFEEALLSFMSDARAEDHQVWARRDCRDVDWSVAPVWWVLDCSPLMSAPTTRPDLVAAVNGLPWMPPPVEVLVEAPDPSNVAPSHLDELYTRLDPDHAWLYVPEDELEPTLHVCAKCATPWGVRELR